MGIKSAVIRPVARLMAAKIRKAAMHPHEMQQKVFEALLRHGRKTAFGKDHDFQAIASYADFRQRVPIRDYEALRPYMDRVIAGDADVLWTGRPLYFAKTSGTTSGTKFIPISRESVKYHVGSARDAVFCYIAETGNADFFDGRMIFLSGSPELDRTNGILTGRLSGIVNHQIPFYARGNQLPTAETNRIEDWETKVEAIVNETNGEDLRLIGGIPSWVQMYFEKLQERNGGKTIGEIFPNLRLYVYGGVNYEPYRKKFENTIGRTVDTIETYPASEGFIAYQDSQHAEGLLLLTDAGIFYEFIPAGEVFTENPRRLQLREVETGINYAIVLNTNAGLWGYLIGDTVRFVSLAPYRIVVTGRISHFISAFGEHVIGEEVEAALNAASAGEEVEVVEFHVAPMVNPPGGELPYHEWFIEFGKLPHDLDAFRAKIDKALRQKNSYYADLIEGRILQPLRITITARDAFRNYMKLEGKLGGQNKVPRLADNRKIADRLEHLNRR